MKTRTIALVGDYSDKVFAHRCIPDALRLAGSESRAVFHEWIQTRDIQEASRDLAKYDAVWCVPASPYENTRGALDAIRFARENGLPFLGTCGGFQHAILEFARDVLKIARAEHAETSPDAPELVVTRLSCSLVDTTGELRFVRGSQLHKAYGADTAHEGYRCNYGVNPAYRSAFEAAGLGFTAFDSAGDPRAFEYSQHPFFVGTLFQPERSAARGEAHPLISAFVRAIGASREDTASK